MSQTVVNNCRLNNRNEDWWIFLRVFEQLNGWRSKLVCLNSNKGKCLHQFGSRKKIHYWIYLREGINSKKNAELMEELNCEFFDPITFEIWANLEDQLKRFKFLFLFLGLLRYIEFGLVLRMDFFQFEIWLQKTRCN